MTTSTHREWPGTITRKQAIRLFDNATSHDDPYWENLTDDFYDEETDTLPTIFHLFAALGVSEEEYKDATGAQNVNWPTILPTETECPLCLGSGSIADEDCPECDGCQTVEQL